MLMKMLIALPASQMATAIAVHAAAHVPVVVWLILLLLLLLLKVLLVRVVLPRMRSGRRMLRSLRRLADPAQSSARPLGCSRPHSSALEPQWRGMRSMPK